MLPGKELNRFPDASGALPCLAVLGPLEVTVPGPPVQLQRKWIEVLLRLVVAKGGAVAVDEIFRDVWHPADNAVRREERISVQKAITGLRAALGPSVIETERIGRVSAYRLVLSTGQLDVERFGGLLERARSADSVAAVDLYRQAVDLWRDRPLTEVAHLPFARPLIDRLSVLREEAMRRLLDAYRDLGRVAEALAVARELAGLRPDDSGLAALVGQLLSDDERQRRGVVRRTFGGGPPFTVMVVSGDIFDERDACLVIGFSDTFDTDTTDDLVINAKSLQAQAMRVVFDDDPALLDRKLRAALRDHTPVARETRATKRRGKLIRYATGTVAVLRHGDRQVFGLAYGRMGNDLVTTATRDDIQAALDRLWDAAYRHGQLRPIAIPLIGTGLARVQRQAPADLLKLIATGFVARSRERRISRELRIVVRPEDLAGIDLTAVADCLDAI